jgi:hypothetical protein
MKLNQRATRETWTQEGTTRARWEMAKHTRSRASNSSDTSSSGAASAPSSSPLVFVSGPGGFCTLEVPLLWLPPTGPFLLLFLFLFPFFLLLETTAGPAHYRDASFPISANAHSEESQGWVVGDVAWTAL